MARRVNPQSNGENAATQRQHKATYASDKRNGGYLVRVAGPYAAAFAGREVPVTRRDGTEHTEKLTRLLWSGTDEETAERIALYSFEQKPREDKEEEIPF